MRGSAAGVTSRPGMQQQQPMMRGGMMMQGQYPQQRWGAQAGYGQQMGGMQSAMPGYGQAMGAYNPQMQQQQQQAMLYQQQMSGPYAAQWQAYYAQQAAQQQQQQPQQQQAGESTFEYMHNSLGLTQNCVLAGKQGQVVQAIPYPRRPPLRPTQLRPLPVTAYRRRRRLARERARHARGFVSALRVCECNYCYSIFGDPCPPCPDHALLFHPCTSPAG